MGVVKISSTFPGGLTPVCNRCGGANDFDISDEEYEEKKRYWDLYICPDCCMKKSTL